MALSSLDYILINSAALYNDANRDKFLEAAQLQTAAGFYGDSYNLAVALRACHIYTLSQRPTGDGGPVLSKSEGDLSISYGQGGTDNLDQTHFGKQLKDIMNQQLPAASVLGAGTTVDESADILAEILPDEV